MVRALWFWEVAKPSPFWVRRAWQVTLKDSVGNSRTWINGELVEEGRPRRQRPTPMLHLVKHPTPTTPSRYGKTTHGA
jgi:hypothetical protein